MKTILKIAAFIVLGVVALAVIGFLLHVATVLLTIAVPLAIVAVVGWVVWKAMTGGGGEAKQPEAPKLAQAAVEAPKKGLSAEDAAKHFDELKKGLKS